LDVSFAPVKTPEYKSIGERFFEVLNVEIWHEADGGVSKPSGKATRDPREQAVFTLQEAQDRLWNWIVTVYHLRVHNELGMAPARKWSEAYNNANGYRRPMIDDMNAVDNVFGRSETRQLTSKGIHYGNEVFHDPELTTSLLHDLYYLNTKNRSAENNNQSIAVTVEILVFDDDVSVIAVYNPVRRSFVRLPNRNPKASGTYEQRAAQREIEDQENDAWFSFDDLAVNEALLAASLTRNKLPSLPDQSNSMPLPMGRVESTAARQVAKAPHDAPTELPVHLRGENTPPRKVRRRGETKAVQTRRRNQKLKAEAEARSKTSTLDEDFEVDAFEARTNVADLYADDAFSVTDLDAFRQSLKDKLRISKRH
jgi:putative transposase